VQRMNVGDFPGKEEWKIILRDKVGRERRGVTSGNLNPGDANLR